MGDCYLRDTVRVVGLHVLNKVVQYCVNVINSVGSGLH